MSWIRAGDAAATASLEHRVRERLARRIAAGTTDRDEIERIGTAPVRRFEADPLVSEAFRRACVAWRIDAPVPLRSHRPLVGPLLVGAKRVVARLLRFHVEVPFARQAEFNRNLLVVLHDLVLRSRGGAER